jgi:hypothetical protein
VPPSRHRRRSAARRSQRRTPPIATGGGFRNRWLLFAFGAIAILFIAALLVPVILPVNFGGSGQGEASEYVEGIGTQSEVSPSQEHFPDTLNIGEVVPEGYLTTPPTSGRHWNGWVQCGFYTSPVPDERIVHNMEHGNIIVSYNLTDQAQIDALAEAFDDIGLTNAWGVARPYDEIPEGTIYLTTWGVIDGPMHEVDGDRIERFFEAYSGKLGPEFPNGAPCTTGGTMNP